MFGSRFIVNMSLRRPVRMPIFVVVMLWIVVHNAFVLIWSAGVRLNLTAIEQRYIPLDLINLRVIRSITRHDGGIHLMPRKWTMTYLIEREHHCFNDLSA